MKQESGKKKRIAANTMYTIGGALVLNGVLQLIIYPYLAARLGSEANGTMLYLMAVIAILGPSIGQALNNSRLVLRRTIPVTNGDYDTALLIFSAAGIIGALIFAGSSLEGAGAFIFYSILILVTNFRYYGDVEYRLTLNYRRYFVYYCMCGAGYAAGLLIYLVTGNWFVIFITGEVCAVAYVALSGGVFRNFFARSSHFGTVMRRGGILVLSYFVTNLTLNIDRIVLNGTLGGTAVTEYYVVSLIGKTLVLFVAPVNTIIISYLTKENARLSRRSFIKYAAAGVVVSAVFFLLCLVATPIFIRIFYPSLYEATRGLVAVVSLTQILAMLSAYLFIVVLTFTGTVWQLALQLIHLGVLLEMIYVWPGHGSLADFSMAVLIANALRIVAVTALGIWKAGSKA